jgi:GNAT superfamily N-acetyltransferase
VSGTGTASPAAIRAAAPGDVPAIEAMVRSAYAKYVERIGRPPAPMTADYVRLVREGDVWVLDRDGGAVGVVVLRSASDHLEIGNVAVAPDHQGKGFGARLLAHAEEEARRGGFTELRLFTNELMHENLALYRKLGWDEYDRVVQDGFRRVLMRKKVAEAAPAPFRDGAATSCEAVPESALPFPAPADMVASDPVRGARGTTR